MAVMEGLPRRMQGWAGAFGFTVQWMAKAIPKAMLRMHETSNIFPTKYVVRPYPDLVLDD